MPITMEAEVPRLFLICFTIVFILKALLGIGLLFRDHQGAFKLFLGHLAAELLSFYYVIRVLFQGRLSFPAIDMILSIDNSVSIGLFGVCWFISVCFLLGVVGSLVSHMPPKESAPEA